VKVAAIYARKSTEQNVADDAKSVTRQIDNARAFATAHGWTVDDRFIFVDDGVSGAETRKLLGKQRLIQMADQFDVVVMQAQDRWSRRDGAEAWVELKALAQRDVEIWFYADARKFEFGTLTTNVPSLLFGEFAAEFRRNIAQKTYEAMERRAKQGHVTGGRTFGYDNVPVNGHKERQINDAEAVIVRDIFQRYADGEGFKQVAHSLNDQHVASPRAQGGRRSGWDPGTVRAVLRRPLYRGVIEWNRTKKRREDGSRHGRQRKKAEAERIRVDAPHLRIVSEDVVRDVDTRLEGRRHAYLRDNKGQLLGRPVAGKHLLAGFIVCACGARFEAVRGYYMCSTRRRKGPSICPSEFVFPVAAIERTFLDCIEQVVLSQDFIDRVLDSAFSVNPNAEREGLIEERKRLATEITNLTTVAAATGDVQALAEALKDRDRRLKAVDAKVAKPVVVPERDVLKAALELRSGQWRDVLRSPQHVAQARLVLQHLIELPIRLFNEPKPKWMTQTRPGGMLVGLVQSMASPPGFAADGTSAGIPFYRRFRAA
jgi:site-specific DNA recombinase